MGAGVVMATGSAERLGCGRDARRGLIPRLPGRRKQLAGLVVQALAKPEMVMEIDVDAVIPDDEA